MNKSIVSAGNKGEKDRSDCFVSLKLSDSGGIHLELKSKVQVLYGSSISALCYEMFKFFQIENAIVEIEDKGALPFVLMARIEAAIKQLIKSDLEFLPEMLSENLYPQTLTNHVFHDYIFQAIPPG